MKEKVKEILEIGVKRDWVDKDELAQEICDTYKGYVKLAKDQRVPELNGLSQSQIARKLKLEHWRKVEI